MIVKRLYNRPTWRFGDAFDELDRMRGFMSTLSRGVRREGSRDPDAGVYPLVNLSEDKDGYHLRAELPGIEAEGLDITASGNSVAISGERKINPVNGDAKYHRRERDAGKFNRIINLPGNINAESVAADLTDGILNITLPKAEEAKPKKITIN